MPDILGILQALLMMVVGVLLWTMRSAFAGGQVYGLSLKRLTDLERRMDRAGEQYSNLATQVQGLPERIRQEFMPREVAEHVAKESYEDRQRLWVEVRLLQSQVYHRRKSDP